MYTSFFGLSDIPFSIAPNPEYLFLGDRHKEALAHLTYGLGDTGGFVLLTGEVGTGKTTISRQLLAQLPESTQVAFILNPTLSCLELLATICDELKIRYKKTGITLKYLTDKIQQKLLSNQADNIDTLLIIDEAQHLQPEVLEQLRLLTNLETNTKKLLQVILIGQPELQQLLQRRDLRQLAQRITARYHLLPLTKHEINDYIKHRLSVADCHRSLFKPSAISLIHKISKGIPRLINLLCDRSLATAYGLNDSVITRKTVLIASEQALGSEYHLKPWWQNPWLIVPSIGAGIVTLAGVGYFLGTLYGQQVPLQAVNASDTQPVAAEQVTAAITNSAAPVKASTSTSQSTQAPNNQEQNRDLHTAQQTISEQSLDTNVSSLPVENTVANNRVESKPNLDTKSKVKPELKSEPKPEPRQELETDTKMPIEFDVTAIEGVSDELLAKVQSALDEQDNSDGFDVNNEQAAEPEIEVPSLMDMPAYIQNAVPSMQFEVHIYANDGNGWVRVNGRERYEGDNIAGDVMLDKILQNSVVMSLDGQQFSLPALSSW